MQKLQYELTLTKHRRNKYLKQNDKKGGETREFKQKRLKQKNLNQTKNLNIHYKVGERMTVSCWDHVQYIDANREMFKNKNIIS